MHPLYKPQRKFRISQDAVGGPFVDLPAPLVIHDFLYFDIGLVESLYFASLLKCSKPLRIEASGSEFTSISRPRTSAIIWPDGRRCVLRPRRPSHGPYKSVRCGQNSANQTRPIPSPPAGCRWRRRHCQPADLTREKFIVARASFTGEERHKRQAMRVRTATGHFFTVAASEISTRKIC